MLLGHQYRRTMPSLDAECTASCELSTVSPCWQCQSDRGSASQIVAAARLGLARPFFLCGRVFYWALFYVTGSCTGREFGPVRNITAVPVGPAWTPFAGLQTLVPLVCCSCDTSVEARFQIRCRCMQVTDVRQHLAQQLAQASQQRPGKLGSMATGMPAECQAKLQEYLQSAGVTLV